jgi:hypothetical protein
MMRSRWLVALVAGAALAAAGLLLAKDKKSDHPKPAAGDFGGKVVQFYNKGDDGGSPPLEKVEVKRIGDRWFVSGAVALDWAGWSKGVWIWTPLEQVGRVTGYESVEHYQKVFADRDRMREAYERALTEYEEAAKAAQSRTQPKK